MKSLYSLFLEYKDTDGMPKSFIGFRSFVLKYKKNIPFKIDKGKSPLANRYRIDEKKFKEVAEKYINLEI